jgi:hypothetical protein
VPLQAATQQLRLSAASFGAVTVGWQVYQQRQHWCADAFVLHLPTLDDTSVGTIGLLCMAHTLSG